MIPTIPFKRLILRAVLHQVSPMIIRLISVPDHLELPKFHNVPRAVLGWDGDLGYIIRIHGQEFNSFRRKTRSKALHEFKLHRQETFLYICDTLHMWEWDVRVIDIQEGAEDAHAAICLDGRGAAPPEFCGGPTGYRSRHTNIWSNDGQVLLAAGGTRAKIPEVRRSKRYSAP
jgi:hypothetical protein